MLVKATTRFERDYARRLAGTLLAAEFAGLLDLLLAGRPLPPRHRDHPLHGAWRNHRDFHLRGDMVVIYRREPGVLVLVRAGTHSDLFG